MPLDSDVLVDRINLKKKIARWQITALVVLALSLIIILSPAGKDLANQESKEDYIARVDINGVIIDDSFRQEVLEDLYDDEALKGLILRVDSPGGTTAGGEALYYQIKRITDKGIPVVVVMRTLATSAGYLVSLAGEHIVAHNGTITGSIGVLIQSAEVTDLAKELGISFNTFKSGKYKAEPSPFSKLDPEIAQATQSVVDDFYDYFVGLVAERREMETEKAKEIADGRIFTGRQALQLGLVDQVGTDIDALNWLQEEKKIPSEIEVKDVSVVEPENNLQQLLFGDMKKSAIFQRLDLSGLLSVWYPDL